MKLKFNIVKSALLTSAFFLLHTAYAQDDVLELLPGADYLEFDNKTGTHKLFGNVNFKYQGNLMYCDSAYYFEQRKIVKAYGNVHINKRDTLNLFCDSLYYNGRTSMATLWGNVRVRDKEFKLTTDTLEYDAKKAQASYKYGGKVESIASSDVLTSRTGYFHPDSKNFFFSRDVHYKGTEIEMTTDTMQYLYSQKKTFFKGPTDIKTKEALMYCESGWYNTETDEGTLKQNAWISRESDYISGDTLLYKPNDGIYEGIGNVYFMDSIQKMFFNGDYAISSDSLNYSLITGNAIASKIMEGDTLNLHADTLYNFKNDSLEVLKAYSNAEMYSRKFQARADSITYSKSNELIELYQDPIVWSDAAELKGRFITMDINDSTITKANIFDNATILMEVEAEQFYNQLYGKNIIAKFRDNELHRAFVNGNAMTIQFPEDNKTTDSTHTVERIGMNRLYSSDLRVDLDSNQITGITYIEQPDGAFYPMDKLEESEQFIPGFTWKYALRPKNREDLLD